jgi:hypothetical protein
LFQVSANWVPSYVSLTEELAFRLRGGVCRGDTSPRDVELPIQAEIQPDDLASRIGATEEIEVVIAPRGAVAEVRLRYVVDSAAFNGRGPF